MQKWSHKLWCRDIEKISEILLQYIYFFQTKNNQENDFCFSISFNKSLNDIKILYNYFDLTLEPSIHQTDFRNTPFFVLLDFHQITSISTHELTWILTLYNTDNSPPLKSQILFQVVCIKSTIFCGIVWYCTLSLHAKSINNVIFLIR